MADASVMPEVLIVGGGVAALETLMALHDLAGDRVRVTVIAPEPEFTFRPMAVAEPFGYGAPRRHSLRRIAEDFGASLVQAGVTAVEASAQRVVLRSGDTMPYDSLVLAPGARAVPAFEEALTFTGPASATEMRALLDEIERGEARRIAFVAPTAAGWILPLYELALLTARHRATCRVACEVILITPEPRALSLFGDRASVEVAELLAAAEVTFLAATQVEVAARRLRLVPGGELLETDRVVALPLLRGPRVAGVPTEREFGFLPVDRHGRVDGLDGVYAAGDATDFPVKQGGLAAQQADAVAEHVAARHGAPVAPAPFRPVLRGLLFAGGPDRYLRKEAPGEPVASSRPLWWPPTKIAGRHLAPYLYAREPAAEPGPAPEGFTDVEVLLEEEDAT